MMASSWVVNVDPSNAASIETREVYAYAGMALGMAQTLEHVLKHFIVLAAAIEKRNTPNATSEQLANFYSELEKFEAKVFKQTLGVLIGSIKSQFRFVSDLEADLEKSLANRNQLVHHLLWDGSIDLVTADGRRRMAEELLRIKEQLKLTVEHFSDATKAIRKTIGITEDKVDELVKAAKAGATETELAELVQKLRTPGKP